MFEALMIVLLCMTSLFLAYVWPTLRHFMNYRKEREMLEKKYNRLHRSRVDLLVSFQSRSQIVLLVELMTKFPDIQGHLDWAIAREEGSREIESLGREVERMGRELAQIDRDIQALERTRFDVNAFVPLKSIGKK